MARKVLEKKVKKPKMRTKDEIRAKLFELQKRRAETEAQSPNGDSLMPNYDTGIILGAIVSLEWTLGE